MQSTASSACQSRGHLEKLLPLATASLDAGTLAAIDDPSTSAQEAAAHGLTRSAFIASAALEQIQRGA
jgi:hypothetical protein